MTKLDRELAELRTMSRQELVERWQAAYACPPPAGARRELLVYAAGWHMQVRRLGGFPGEVRRLLRREVERIRQECCIDQGRTAGDGHDAVTGGDEPSPVMQPSAERRRLVPGARLLRDWNGRTHAVDVTQDGYLYDGITYRSLSAIARRITGAHWSGPRFFGL